MPRTKGTRRSWREKLETSDGLPRVQLLTGAMRERLGPGTILLPSPLEVDELMRAVPRGRLTTINQIREQLAAKHGVTTTCPIVTGIFARIAAGAAGEDEVEGKRDVTPYWRTLRARGELNPKYPGGVQAQRARLESEGHRVLTRGKTWRVEGYEARLVPSPVA